MKAYKPDPNKGRVLYRPSRRLVGWRYAAFLGGFVSFIGLAFFGSAIYPMVNPEPWQKIQDVTRKDIDPEKTLPPGMKVWTDPFDRPEKNNRMKKRGKEEENVVLIAS